MAGEESVPSVGDSIADALERVEQGEGAGGSKPEAPAPAQEPSNAAPVAPATPAPTPKEGRDASGKFVKRQATADTPAAVTAAAPAAQPAPAAPPATGTPAPATEADTPPAGWRAEMKAKWAGLDPEVKTEILRRERDVNIGMQRAAESRKFGDSIYREVAPYMEMLQAEGASPQDAVRILLETAYTLRNGSPEHKKAIMLSLINQYGVDFSTGLDPERAELQRRIDLRDNEDRRQAAQRSNDLHQSALSEVEQFAQAPGHEHMETLRPHMIALLREGAAKDLEDAYTQAAWAHPQVRQTMQQAENVRRQQDLTKNRNAAAAVTGSPGGVSTKPSADPKNLRATLEEAFSGGRA